MPTRRSVLGSICATAAVATAGCLGGGSDDGDEDADSPDVPPREEASAAVDAYLAAVSQGNVEVFNDVVHPESPLADTFSDEDIEQTGQVLSYRYQNMEVTEYDEQSGTATVTFDLLVITADDRETTESSQQLRARDGEWKIWLTVPPESGGSDDGE
jgi:hypothetical protein